MKLISIVTPCYNEETNVREIYSQVKQVFEKLPDYSYEHIFIDNASVDKTVELLKEIAAADKNIKIIVNSRNFGHIRSPFYGLLQAQGDAATIIAADLQEPPSLIADFIKKWEQGYKIVIAVKNNSDESKIMFAFRNLYYNMVKKLADVELIRNYAGFGMYDKKVIDILRKIDDPYPYVRGIISEIGFEKAIVEFIQPKRKKGLTKNNFFTLYDLAMLGITNHSKIPLRIATMIGFLVAAVSIVIALVYFVYKIIFWESFTVGVAPLVIGLFFFSAVQLFFIGILGEYIGAIHTQVLKRPLVIEKERVNFTSGK
ncbi:MAG: dolichol monophosphate mannose synthase [Candidatus Firestonebacteria bacterium RIFOXYA2_FULL_40_8]|nr:MAG: dolichol monophosphate mannose synthase [Candidatus Firestonebacteria bacterium RIFOXYA2_FULL_40_8]